jgi:hypothetical protein
VFPRFLPCKNGETKRPITLQLKTRYLDYQKVTGVEGLAGLVFEAGRGEENPPLYIENPARVRNHNRDDGSRFSTRQELSASV